MGLLSRLGRAAGAGIGEAADLWKWHSPLGNAAIGGGVGAIGGAGMNPSDPIGGAMTGAAVGAGLMGGANALGGPIRGGLRAAASEFGLPEQIARRIRDTARQPGQMEAMVEQIRTQDPDLASEVMRILMQNQP